MKIDYTERTVSSNEIFNGKIIKVKVDTVILPNGNESKREIVNHPGAVGVLAITSENKLVLVKQYRKPMDEVLIEIPAGKLEVNEEPSNCALRELKEETGYTATNISQIASFYTSPGFADEYIYLFKATNLEAGVSMPDDDEFVEIIEVTYEEASQLVASEEIKDAKTLIAIYHWQVETLNERTK